ncbi:hypothetical protein EC2862600_3321 [Escherichia coli 2862600]|nr:hypothetical protein EC2862600_3321 [Escherichia coli 2862600]ENB74512.1 hypothetical protein ECP02989428_3241 [Escherichia coli P0298942.8]ENB76714.1 hypothetical protein ECP02989429_3076 [Escherichia coli P0298942.9]END65059.1 hypothetical protein ECP02989423_3489 [Escherichia coli P0298942.3]
MIASCFSPLNTLREPSSSSHAISRFTRSPEIQDVQGD